MKTISPAEAHALIRDGALLVDVREPHEHASEHIEGAQLASLSEFAPQLPKGADVVFHCKAGGRTTANAARLSEAANAAACTAYELKGGIEAWKAAGLPVIRATIAAA